MTSFGKKGRVEEWRILEKSRAKKDHSGDQNKKGEGENRARINFRLEKSGLITQENGGGGREAEKFTHSVT